MIETAFLKEEDLPHYTHEDYSQWEGRWELIGGIPFAMVPMPKVNHQRLCCKIIRYLGDLLDPCPHCEVLLPVDWQVAEDTVVQPDVIVVCKDGEDIGVERLLITPVMVFEVLSPSTSHKDKVLKYRLYEEAGVKYYCILDPDTGSAVVFTLKSKKYDKSGDFKSGSMILDLGPCRIDFDFSEIFK